MPDESTLPEWLAEAATGDPFDIRYLWIVTRRNGKVTRLQDYMSTRRPTTKEA